MYTPQQEKLRESDSVKIARRFEQSPFIYDGDSKNRQTNPNYHPTICQRENGSYCTVDGDPLPLSKVPDYIKEQGKPPRPTGPAARQELTLEQAMRDAEASNKTADAPQPKRGRGRPRKNAA